MRFLRILFNKQRLAVVPKLFIDNRQKATALHTVVPLNAYSIEYRGRNIHTTAKRLADLAVGPCRRVAPDEWHANQTVKVQRPFEQEPVITQIITMIACKRDYGIVRQTGFSQSRNNATNRSEEHTSEIQSLMPISSAAFCL